MTMHRIYAIVLIWWLVAPPAFASYKFTAASTDEIALNTDPVPTTGCLSLWVRAASPDNDRFPFSVTSGGKTFRVANHDAGSTTNGGWVDDVGNGRVTTTVMSADTWTHYLLNWSGSETRFYHQGAEVGTAYTGTSRIWDTTGTAKFIGNLSAAFTQPTTIYLAEVGLWSATCDAAVRAGLSSGKRASCFATSAVSYWALVSDASDSVGSDNGTANGAVSDALHPSLIDCTGTAQRQLLLGM